MKSLSRLHLLLAAASAGAVLGCSNNNTTGSNVLVVSQVEISPNGAALIVGQTQQFAATPKTSGGTPVSGRDVRWSTSSPAVATVSTSGLVTAITVGSASISATVDRVVGAVTVNVSPVPVASVTVNPGQATILVGEAAQLAATPRDGQGNALSGRTVSWESDNPAIASVTTTGSVIGINEGNTTIRATVEGTVGSASVTVNPRPASRLGFVAQPQNGTAGQPLAPPVRVAVQDDIGRTVTTATTTITLALAENPGNATLAGTLAANAVQGVATFADLVLNSAAAGYTLRATAAPLSPGISNPFAIGAGAPGGLGVTTQPAGAKSGVPLVQQPVVQVRDAAANPVAQAGVAVTATLVGPGATLSGTLTVNSGAGGAAAFTNLVLTGSAGSYTLRFTAPGLTETHSAPLALGGGTPTQLAVVTQPSARAVSGAILGTQPVLQLKDGNGNDATEAGIVITAAITSGAGTLGGTATATTNATGQAAFTNLVITGSTGEYTLGFTAPGLTGTSSELIRLFAGLVITTPDPLPAGVVNLAYGTTLTASGGTGTTTWSLTSGTLPAGLTLDAATGVISGTPTAVGLSGFTIQVTDATQTATKALSMTVNSPLVITTTSPLPTGAVGVVYSATLVVTGGGGANSWSVTAGTLPAGLTLAAATGVISGTPTTGGLSTFTVRVTDGDQATTKVFDLSVNSSLAITTPSPLPAAVQNVAYTTTLTAAGGAGTNTWSVTVGTLPAGLTLAPATGVISGTPTTPGTSNFTVQVTDGVQTAATAFDLTVNATLAISTASPLPNAAVGTAYSTTLAATGGAGTNTWSVTVGTLPAGLALAPATGIISGTPTTVGTSNFTVQVTDGVQTVTKPFALTVSAAMVITTVTPLPAAVQLVAYTTSLAVTGGLGTNTWSVTVGTLPVGLTLAPTTGVISGTPTTAGTSNFTIQVTDGVQTVTKAFTLTVNATLAISTTSPLPSGAVSVAYSVPLVATGGVPASYAWSVTVGTLPAGLSLAPTTGVISGTPTAGGTSNFTIRVTDGVQAVTKAFTLLVNASLAITTVSPLPAGVQSLAYTTTLAATGGAGAYTWSVTLGTLPTGLTLAPATGIISGTPTAVGTSNFTVQVTDGVQNATKAFALTVNAGLAISTTSPLPAGAVGTAYSTTLAGTGGVPASYAWSVAIGSLPAGLGLNGTSGAITGTPSGAGTSNFTVQLTDGTQTVTKAFSLTVNAALSITTASPLPRGVQGTVYSTTVVATGGTGSYTWNLIGGTLPAGLSLSAAGVISGTPSASGTSGFTVQASDGTQTTSKPFALTIDPTLAITTTSPLPDGIQGTAYSSALLATGGNGTYSWGLTGGTLPAGLSLSGAGVLSGTPTTTGSSSFTAQVTSGVQTRSATYLVTVYEALSITTTTPLPSGTQNVAYSIALAAAGGTGSYAWSVSAGAVPAGLSLSAAGVLSGSPTGFGTSNFTAQVVSGSQTTTKPLSVTINPPPLVITTTSPLPNAIQSSAYSTTLVATGGTGSYSWSLASGTLPSGLSLSAGGVISGTPTGTGASTFSVGVTDGTVTQSKSLTLTVTPVVVITTASPLPTGTQTVAYSTSLAATGGSGSYTWSLFSGTLPAGLSLSAAGVISGTPSGSGLSNFTVQVTDGTQTKTKAFALTVNATLAISTASPLPAGAVGVAYNRTLAGTGGTPASYAWSVSVGSLPAGLTIAPSTGVISGTPSGSGTSNFTVQLTDGTQTTTKAFALTVNAALNITTGSPLPGAIQGTAYTTTVVATGGSGSNTWSVSVGSLPAGLTLAPSTGVISGTPSVPGTSNFTIQVTDGTQTDAKAFALTVVPIVSITTGSTLPNGIQNTAYNTTLVATGGSGSYTWSMFSGSLPAGLSLSAAGVISGTPTGSGTPPAFTVQVTDGTQIKTKAFTLTLIAELAISTASPLTPDGIENSAYSKTLATTGGSGAKTWSLVGGALPTGLSVSAGGVISGTPTAPGASNFTLQVTDGTQTTTKVFDLTVIPELVITTTSPLPDGTAGTPGYSTTLQATGGTGTITWAVTVGSLPAGLTLNTATGEISGTPTTAGTSNFTVQATSGTQIKPQALALTIN